MATAVEPVWEQWTRNTILPPKLLTVGDWWALLAHRPYTVPKVGGLAQVTQVFGSVANSANIVDWMVMKLSDEDGIAIAEYTDFSAGFYVLVIAGNNVLPTTPLGSVGANFQQVVNAGGGSVPPDGSITTAKLADNSVTSAKIVDGTIATADIASGAITDALITGPISYAKISGTPTTLPPSGAAGGDLTGSYPAPTIRQWAVVENSIAGQSISTRTLQNQAVTTPILADASVTTQKLAALAVTNAQLAQNSVTSWNIADGTIQTIDIASRAITEALLAPNSVGTPELITAAVTTSKIANLAITDALVNDVSWAKITGAPTTLPPSGNAGGSLTGTYPNPTIAAGAVGNAQLASASVQDANIVSLAWGKLTGVPTGISPTGPATGDLTGTYPGPTIAPLAVTSGKIAAQAVGTAQLADANVTDAKIVSLAYTKLTGAPAALPPSGAAGGSLSGAYPNPAIAAGAVMRAMLGSDVTPSLPPLPGVPNANMIVSVNGTGSALVYQAAPPATLTPGQVTTLYLGSAPSGVATGNLNDGAVTDVKITSVSWSKLIGTPPAGVGGAVIGATPPASPQVGQMWWRNDPDGNLYLYYNDGNSSQWVPAMSSVATVTGPAGGDLTGSYPNPTLVAAQKNLWTAAASILSPLDSATIFSVLGNSSTGEAVRVGTRTPKMRLIGHPTYDNIGYLTINGALNAGATAWLQDDATKPTWLLSMRGETTDAVQLLRAPAGAPGSLATLLTVDNAGNLTTAGIVTIQGSALRVQSGTTSPLTLYANLGTVDGWGCYQAGSVSSQAHIDFYAAEAWTASARGTGCAIYCTPTGTTSASAKFTFDGTGNLTITGPTGTKSTGTTWANPSDIRLKRDIADYETGLEAITKLRPVSFKYNGKGGTTDDNRLCWGLIADEVQPVMPEMVGSTTAKLDADDEEETDILSLDTSNVALALINAVKELATRVAVLEGQ